MNYRHIYHAGSFSDVFKHILLIALIQSLLRKDKPFCYLDTHAGIGNYNLQEKTAQKTQEFTTGISKFWTLNTASLPPLIARYVEIAKTWNADQGASKLHYYPGSPIWVRKFLRPCDQMILTELHPQDIMSLKRQFLHDSQVAIHHLSGYQALKAFLPPKESRGLVLIDPPFEKTDEFAQIVKQLQLAIRRWCVATYAVWYPIKDCAEIDQFCQNLKATGIRKILRCEIKLPDIESDGLNACGMMVINPPWQWQEEITAVLPTICDILSAPDKGSYSVTWLVPE